MGHVFVEMTVRGEKGEASLQNVLVDTGATYTVIPEDVLTRIGAVKLPYEAQLELGNGTRINAQFYSTVIKVLDRQAPIIAATFEGAKPFLGVLTLESAGLKVDPITGKLEPTRPEGLAYLYSA